ncbi:DUF4105 domain-containing protein, partial [bacterium]|nr:DUF4105 domain-containing protein [bacterium]
MRKNIFLFSLLFFQLVYFQLFAESNAFIPVTETTKTRLFETYGIDLIDKKNAPFWTEIEGQAFIDILNQIPQPIAFVVKKTNHQPVKLRKYYSSISLSPSGFGIRKSFGQFELPVYSKTHMLSAAVSKNPDYSLREKEQVTFLFDNNLIAADLSELDAQKDPSILQQRLKYYIPYLQRELVQLLLSFYNEETKISDSDDWLSISDWKYSSFLFMDLPWVTSTSNRFIAGYAHPIGLEGPEADFISYGASFFVTPITFYSRSIKCGTPRKYQFFKTLFPDYKPHLDDSEFSERGVQCPDPGNDFSGNQFKDIHTGQPIEIGPISPETVKGFELIYATPGDQEISEIAGHLLLRIKLDNNPQAEALGIENPKDLVIAVFANSLEDHLENTQTNSDATTDKIKLCRPKGEEPELDIDKGIQMASQALKGLAGLYLTTIQVDTLQHVIQQYTVNGNRNLMRYRLILSDSEKALLLEHLYIVSERDLVKYNTSAYSRVYLQ